jgi:hypothetical protein
MLSCVNLYRNDQPEYYLSEALSEKCWAGSHLSWTLGFVLPLLITWAILFPVISLLILYNNRSNLENDSVRSKYAFLYIGYGAKKFFWEYVILLRKYLLIGIILLNVDVDLQIYLSLYVIVVFYVIQSKTLPF